jgi:MFS superfamily sulfate permease-like transporter
VSPREFRLSLVTLLGVITVGVLPGVVVAVVLALLQLLASTSRPHDAVLGRMPGEGGFRDLSRHPEARPVPGLLIFRVDAMLVFFNADHFKARLRAVVAAASPAPRCVILDAGTMPGMDSTGAAALGEVREELAARGITLAVAEARGMVQDMLARTGLGAQVGADLIFPTVEAAVERLEGVRA